MNGLVISAWSAISPFGYGHAAFTEGMRDRRRTAADAGGELACLVPDFDVRALLGAKGTRSMNRVTGLAVATAGMVLEKIGRAAGSAEEIGVVLGTTTGSAESMMALTRASLVGEKPDHIEPALVPSCVMNFAAGQVAIWHQIKGPNATIAAGRNTGLVALNYARRLLVTGRARKVLCGAVEEYTTARSRLERCSRNGSAPATPLGEGCAILLIEPESAVLARGDRPLATLVAFESTVAATGEERSATVRAVGKLLDKAGVTAGEVDVAFGPGLDEIFGQPVSGQEPVHELIGDTSSVATLFQIAGLLGEAPRLAVIASGDDDGSVSCALVRVHGAPTPRTGELAAVGGVR